MNKMFFNSVGKSVNVAVVNFKCASVDDCTAVDSFDNPNAKLMEEIRKEEEDRMYNEQKNITKIQLQEDSYRQEKEKLELRKQRGYEAAKAKQLKARTAENEKFASGGISIEDHKIALTKISEDYNKEMRDVEREYDNAFKKLKQMNPEGYRRVDW